MKPPVGTIPVSYTHLPLYKAAAQVTEVLRPSENSSGDMEKATELMPAVDEEYARTIAAIKEL